MPDEGASQGPAERALHGEVFGTTWSAKWRGGPDEDTAAVAIELVLEQVDARMSTWRDDSELQAVRRGDGPVPVSVETYEVVDAALDLARATGGAFDPTVEPLMELWGFRGEQRTEAPSGDALDAVRGQIGWEKVALSVGDDRRPRIDAGGTALDLSAIAKGHGVDRVSVVLSRLGAADHLVEIGGEVRAHGSGPSGPWRLGVDTPEEGLAPGQQLAAVVGLTNASLATSGNYRNTYEVDGQRVVHTMDPRTGRPHDSPLASVTVVAPDCRAADGWATAVMVLGPDAGLEALERRPELEGLLLVSTAEGFVQRATSGMELLLVTDEARR